MNDTDLRLTSCMAIGTVPALPYLPIDILIDYETLLAWYCTQGDKGYDSMSRLLQATTCEETHVNDVIQVVSSSCTFIGSLIHLYFLVKAVPNEIGNIAHHTFLSFLAFELGAKTFLTLFGPDELNCTLWEATLTQLDEVTKEQDTILESQPLEDGMFW